ncbi:hypothetical protein GCM10009715_05820 [Paeniglutamicibacter psychrophenolicus]|uniref:DUF4145 domain-containing protein n=1 Tax=Paeniglutamicibacter psychrophenolicus TaxID=257454 RepID=A0ABS4WEM9_9MICC|nr:hypothetical protein [Paeniglutamicibacter psychrophenolicus]MBP2374378.1 hypothetical protein [Paeniglutamicibacter psychrophenolicus]
MESDDALYLARVKEKLKPAVIRSTMTYAGLFQLTHQLIELAVVGKVKSHYGFVDFTGPHFWMDDFGGERDYKEEVLKLSPKNKFLASVQWLLQQGGLTRQQADQLREIYDHRNDLAHELTKYIIDVDHEPNYSLLGDALIILRDLDRFWMSKEAGAVSFDVTEESDLDDVQSGTSVVLSLCLQACIDSST